MYVSFFFFGVEKKDNPILCTKYHCTNSYPAMPLTYMAYIFHTVLVTCT